MTLRQSCRNIIYNIHIMQMTVEQKQVVDDKTAYSGTKTRDELLKLIHIVSTKPTSYHILNCIINANATFNHQQTFWTQLAFRVIVPLPEFMLVVRLLKEEIHDNSFFRMIFKLIKKSKILAKYKVTLVVYLLTTAKILKQQLR